MRLLAHRSLTNQLLGTMCWTCSPRYLESRKTTINEHVQIPRSLLEAGRALVKERTNQKNGLV